MPIFRLIALPVTETLSARLIGLPVSIDLADSAINRVIDVLVDRT